MKPEVEVVAPAPAPAVVQVEIQKDYEEPISEEARLWAHERLIQLVREQFAIDWGNQPGVQLMRTFRANEKGFAVFAIAVYLITLVFRWVFW